jgi:hypothetical protein
MMSGEGTGPTNLDDIHLVGRVPQPGVSPDEATDSTSDQFLEPLEDGFGVVEPE